VGEKISSMSKSIFAHCTLPTLVILTYLFLYLPIIVLIIFSFNASDVMYVWSGFSLHWYFHLLHSSEIRHVIFNSLIVAFSSVILSVTMGTLLVYGAKKYIERLMIIFYGSMLFPEIVIAVSLLTVFSFFSVPLGFVTLIAGHTLLGLGFVIPIVYGQYEHLDESIIEAGLDLGASHVQIFFYVILPYLAPALLASSLLVFIISFDDFLISFFCAGATTQTLSLYIFAQIRTGLSPEVSALSSLIVFISSLGVLILSSPRVRILERMLS